MRGKKRKQEGVSGEYRHVSPAHSDGVARKICFLYENRFHQERKQPTMQSQASVNSDMASASPKAITSIIISVIFARIYSGISREGDEKAT